MVGHLQDDLAAQGQALGGLGKTCAELMQVGAEGAGCWRKRVPVGASMECCTALGMPGSLANLRPLPAHPPSALQAVQSIAGATSGIEGRLQALLAKPPVVTGGGLASVGGRQGGAASAGTAAPAAVCARSSCWRAWSPPSRLADMGIQTSPALAGVVAASIQTSPVLARMAAAGTQVSPTLLHAFNQRRPSTADRQLAAAPPSAAATAPARGLRSAAATAGAVVPQPTAKPTTSALAAAPSLARRQANRPAAAVVAVAPQPEALPRTTGVGEPGVLALMLAQLWHDQSC